MKNSWWITCWFDEAIYTLSQKQKVLQERRFCQETNSTEGKKRRSDDFRMQMTQFKSSKLTLDSVYFVSVDKRRKEKRKKYYTLSKRRSTKLVTFVVDNYSEPFFQLRMKPGITSKEESRVRLWFVCPGIILKNAETFQWTRKITTDSSELQWYLRWLS